MVPWSFFLLFNHKHCVFARIFLYGYLFWRYCGNHFGCSLCLKNGEWRWAPILCCFDLILYCLNTSNDISAIVSSLWILFPCGEPLLLHPCLELVIKWMMHSCAPESSAINTYLFFWVTSLSKYCWLTSTFFVVSLVVDPSRLAVLGISCYNWTSDTKILGCFCGLTFHREIMTEIRSIGTPLLPTWFCTWSRSIHCA